MEDLDHERVRRTVAGALFDRSYAPLRVGRFVLLRKVGEGGMGEVHAAYDEKLGRRVALKVVHPHRTDSPRSSQRFLREAQAMARLSHPNVIQLYEAGEHEGLTYLVLEFVEGPTLDTWLVDESHSAAEILAVFRAIGLGLAAAHKAGVVHRDFKPGNVLLPAGGEPKVADFGLATLGLHSDRLAETGPAPNSSDVRLTRTGELAGTPLFMSPEQWERGTGDARSDQFSFCVALYRAIYRADPFGGDSLAQRRERVTATDATSPPATAGAPAWLWPVLARGLRRDPSDRYPTMNQLLSALAYDPTKRRRTVALGLAAAASIGVAIAWGPMERRRVKERCEAEAARIYRGWGQSQREGVRTAFAKVATEVPYATPAWDATHPRIDAYAEAWSRERERACVSAGLTHPLPEELASRSHRCFEELAEQFDVSVAALRDATAPLVDQATALLDRLPAPTLCREPKHLAQRPGIPDRAGASPEYHAIRRALMQAGILSWRGQTKEARMTARPLIERARALGLPSLLARTYAVLGEVEMMAWRGPQAEDAFRQAYRVAAAAGDDQVALEAAVGLMFVLTEMAGRPQEALWWHDVAQPLIKRLGLADHPDVAQAWRGYGGAQHALGNFEEALVAYRHAHATMRAAFGPSSTLTATLFGDMATVQLDLEEYDDARETLEGTIAVLQAARGPDHPSIAVQLNNLGAVHAAAGDLDGALASYERGLRITEAAYGPDHTRCAVFYSNIAHTHVDQRNYAAAVPLARQAVRLRRDAFGRGHVSVGSSLRVLGLALVGLGQWDEATSVLLEARRIYEGVDGQADTEAIAEIDAALAQTAKATRPVEKTEN